MMNRREQSLARVGAYEVMLLETEKGELTLAVRGAPHHMQDPSFHLSPELAIALGNVLRGAALDLRAVQSLG